MPKNIVLLSDGTGNSAAKPFKTNVWRLYQALDLGPPRVPGQVQQIVFYDEGVGTENFKPLRLLGLAFGIGLARNVKDLYTFLCRNYNPGDGIFLFGFSRGAFTVRVLAGLVLRCGLVTASNEADLEERVELAYSEYKRDVARRATATRPRLIAGRILGGPRRGYNTNHITLGVPQLFPRISFIGVWDTVDAYGMPIDELKLAIDRYLWPMTVADRNLSPYIDRACQALSLDDERPTFRPVLWDERIPPHARLTQVWFSGVHANVGGGYPDDGLAYVAMQWMLDEAGASGLRFYPQDRIAVDNRTDTQAKQYDSRSGLAGYYRYGPRIVDRLCNDTEHGVQVRRPKVHASVQDRIRQRQVAYAPVSFPSDYQVFRRTGQNMPLEPVAPQLGTPQQNRERIDDMEAAWDAVFRRRVAYFTTVALTLLLAAFPVLDYLGWLPGSLFGWNPIPEPLSTALSSLLKMAARFTPSWTAWWLASFAKFPVLFLISAVMLLWLFFKKSHELQKEIFARAEYAWRRV